ncbi:MAG TPA: NADH-quinone oxidoreductase subunit L [Thermoanaerobaculia bacterium]|nr:NADH-quinone oxidoreductase subunit L [Thermoanaerobaculia bacterium]
MRNLLWVIPVLPFLGALLNGFLLRGRIGKKAVAGIACGTVALAAVLGLLIIVDYLGSPEYAAHKGFEQDVYAWIPAGPLATAADGVKSFTIPMGFLIDPLSAVMLFVVTFVGFWIHLYSAGYMAHEDGFQRYFTYLNLFMGAMLLLILGNNYVVMFVGWEGVGLCSYLLIGFYYKEEFPPYAGRKAFITNRVGDFGFVLGLFALVSTFGTLKYSELFPRIADNPSLLTGPGHFGLTLAGFIALCLFIGAMGKSAQIPLYVWLPDAMAGPTPVSALIHAATMVTAGVYMVVRSNVIYQLAPSISMFVAVIGATTAIFAATIGLVQTDIKKVLAYSTVSQLGYMFLAAGLGAYTAAVFHLMTHAFFKALLFLGSGSVIHAMGGEQDMRKMGGLKKHMPATYKTFVIGSLAIAGIPPLAGFFSKDEILHAAAAGGHWVLYAVGLLTAALTAFYMFRAVNLTFHGKFRGTHEQEHHLHESPPSMTIPLWVLAVGAVISGLVGVPVEKWNAFHHFLQPVIYRIAGMEHEEHHPSVLFNVLLIAVAIVTAVVGIGLAMRLYSAARGLATEEAWERRLPFVHRVLSNKYYVDELYDKTVIGGAWGLARTLFRFDAGFIDGMLVHGARNLTLTSAMLSGFFDKYVVDGLVNLTATLLDGFSRLFRRLQTGYVSNYALVLAVGMFALVAVYMLIYRG